MIAYPVTLPTPRVSGHIEAIADNTMKSQFDYNKEIQYIQKDKDTFNYSVILTAAELLTFQDFWNNLNYGLSPFTVTGWDILTNTIEATRFTNPYSYKLLGNNKTEISCEMEVIII